jgi:hypothetical protein
MHNLMMCHAVVTGGPFNMSNESCLLKCLEICGCCVLEGTVSSVTMQFRCNGMEGSIREHFLHRVVSF